MRGGVGMLVGHGVGSRRNGYAGGYYGGYYGGGWSVGGARRDGLSGGRSVRLARDEPG